MQVASKDLCEQLHDLSGWGIKDHDINRKWSRNGIGDWFLEPALPWVHDGQIPAYDLGYLLRKLPHFIELLQLSGGYTPNGWRAIKKSSQDFWHKGGPIEMDDNTPENALCKLAIQLFKQNILTPENE